MSVNVKKMKMMVSSENGGKVAEKCKFCCPIFKKGVGIIYIYCQFCRCWVRKRYSGVRNKLKEDSKFNVRHVHIRHSRGFSKHKIQ